jgi:flagellar protein FliO/FliZ
MNATDQLMMLTRVFLSLLVVVVLAVIAARLARRAGMPGGGRGVRVLERVPLNRDASLAVVRLDDRALVLGVTSHTVTVVSEFDSQQVDEIYPEPPANLAGIRIRRLPEGAPDALSRYAPRGAAVPGRPVEGGTGSVLDPRTWRQGIAALREMTTRHRG